MPDARTGNICVTAEHSHSRAPEAYRVAMKTQSIRHMTVAVAAVALSFIAMPSEARSNDNDRDRTTRARETRTFRNDDVRFGRRDVDRARDFSVNRFTVERGERTRRFLDDDRLRGFRRDDDRFDRFDDDDRRVNRLREDDRRDRRDRDSGNKRRHRRGSSR